LTLRFIATAFRRLFRAPKVFWLAPVVAALGLMYAYTFTARLGISMRLILREPVSAAGAPFYYGYLASLAGLIWAVGAAACLFAAACVRRSDRDQTRRDGRFLLYSGLLTGFLAFDDIFLFHERIATRVFQLTEKEVFSAYAIIALVIAIRFRRTLARSNYLLIVAACALFAVSLVQDLWPPAWLAIAKSSKRTLLEDGPKFVGIVAWSAYLIQTSLEIVRRWHGEDQRVERGGRPGRQSASVGAVPLGEDELQRGD